MAKGTVYMLPNTLGGEQLSDIIPNDIISIISDLRYFIVEDLRSARRFLRKADRSFPIDDSTFYELNKHTNRGDISTYLKPCMEGKNLAVISEAGCPGVADPGGSIVAEAHKMGIPVKPLVGPNSILMTLMASGFSGQEFSFHGYLPKDRKDRIKVLKQMEMDVHRSGVTHLFMDTPFRNMNVLEDLLNELADHTELCIASNITLSSERINTMSVKEWREKAYDLSKSPTMFALGKSV